MSCFRVDLSKETGQVVMMPSDQVRELIFLPSLENYILQVLKAEFSDTVQSQLCSGF